MNAWSVHLGCSTVVCRQVATEVIEFVLQNAVQTILQIYARKVDEEAFYKYFSKTYLRSSKLSSRHYSQGRKRRDTSFCEWLV